MVSRITVKGIRRSQIALAGTILIQALLIIFVAKLDPSTESYDVYRNYFFSLGLLDNSNDSNFSLVSRIMNETVASNIIMTRIHVQNLALLFSVFNLIYAPFYLDFIGGRHLKSKKQFWPHLLLLLIVFLAGYFVFYNSMIDEDYFSFRLDPPNSNGLPSIEGWLATYVVAQVFLIFWSGLIFSALLLVARSLFVALGGKDGHWHK